MLQFLLRIAPKSSFLKLVKTQMQHSPEQFRRKPIDWVFSGTKSWKEANCKTKKNSNTTKEAVEEN